MSEPQEGWNRIGAITCPYCKEPDQDCEDLGDHPSYLSGECSACGKQFSVDVYNEVYYDEKGDKIK